MSIIAVDFDGTIVTHEFPKIGALVPGVVKVISTLISNGHRIFLWTMRGYCTAHKFCLEDAVEFCERKNIKLSAVNRSPGGFSTTSPKQHANLYIDDSALGCPLCMYPGNDSKNHHVVDWKKVAKILLIRNYINKEQYQDIINDINETYAGQGITYQPCSEPSFK